MAAIRLDPLPVDADWHLTDRKGPFFLLTVGSFSSKTLWRRERDSNPRKVALHTLSKRADSAALAPLQGWSGPTDDVIGPLA